MNIFAPIDQGPSCPRSPRSESSSPTINATSTDGSSTTGLLSPSLLPITHKGEGGMSRLLAQKRSRAAHFPSQHSDDLPLLSSNSMDVPRLGVTAGEGKIQGVSELQAIQWFEKPQNIVQQPPNSCAWGSLTPSAPPQTSTTIRSSFSQQPISTFQVSTPFGFTVMGPKTGQRQTLATHQTQGQEGPYSNGRLGPVCGLTNNWNPTCLANDYESTIDPNLLSRGVPGIDPSTDIPTLIAPELATNSNGLQLSYSQVNWPDQMSNMVLRSPGSPRNNFYPNRAYFEPHTSIDHYENHDHSNDGLHRVVCQPKMEPPFRGQPTATHSSSLDISMMGHQEQGVLWMKSMEESAVKGGILADEMGLGKTIQALSLIASRPPLDTECHATLIVVPAGLIRQWNQEIERTLNGQKRRYNVYILHDDRRRPGFPTLNTYHIVLTTYHTVVAEMRRLTQALDRGIFQSSDYLPILGPTSRWHRVILDEAHCIRNEKSKSAEACCNISATYRWCLSGTPVMNGLRDLYSLLKFLQFRPVDTNGRKITIEEVIQSVVLRRTKETTLGESSVANIPLMVTEKVYVTFNEKERNLYSVLESDSQLRLSQFLDGGSSSRNASCILGLLQRLRQACCHPFLVSTSGPMNLDSQDVDEHRNRNALQLKDAVVERLQRNSTDSLWCPICLDYVINTIIAQCGHGVCVRCFDGICLSAVSREPPTVVIEIRCPTCRELIDPVRATDYFSFAACYLPRSLNNPNTVDYLLEWPAEWFPTISDKYQCDYTTHDFTSDSRGRVHTSHQERLSLQRSGRDLKRSFAWGRNQALENPTYRERYRQALDEGWVSSSKIDKALEIVESIQAHGEEDKVVIFSQFTAMLDLLEVPLIRRDWCHRRYDGTMSLADRHSVIEDFTALSSCRILLVSLKAGNAGLNLSAASHVIILDPSWNPHNEEQAVGRVHRIGQQKQVQVYRILIRDSVEDRILKFQEKKCQLAQRIFSDMSTNVGKLPSQDLAYIFGMEQAACE